ncbi:nucleotide exchange factor GrpE [Bosea sp. F3-2]|uniref:nucleotide exchange factor GrpE n=1 Tax=Bosea sp. F3-2 TaxID=2599640 RepID=UPI0020C02755|nr:nucleotide exchange factor GrpE [Bosea sp. F3-2]
MTGGKDEARRGRGTPSGESRKPAAAGASARMDESGEAAAGQGAVNEPATPPESVTLAALQSENAALKDRLLRALAETENVRRRAERDLHDARQYAVAKFARDLLPVVDNMERAIASVPAEVRRSEGAVKALIEGVALTEKELLRVLAKHGVHKLTPVGERFDPHFHEALFEVPDPTVPDGTVSQVVEPGYSIGTRPLRPAKVGVARGGPSGKPPSGR